MKRFIDVDKALEIAKSNDDINDGIGDLYSVRCILEDTPTANVVEVDKLYNGIAGHSYYHGDRILARIACLAEGKSCEKSVEPSDVVEVVRCKDCEKSIIKEDLIGNTGRYCRKRCEFVSNMGYCFWGDRKKKGD